ncbi:long-chain-fatty-acid--CoA ligase [Streptomyces europaeiscabiei]|uniref:long-chain-fatty-acid--CoA ligase n=1 Tax=Streptomyces europaeiscabiei TaxID=146819 RepID=UPI0029A925AE|nr:long-chain-fatty-acid--CoA ligase [Streptomyces europaeiscabiei]MDX3629637.1 long-chain-fatty-acid--CoA ligase [Streptomyces europaeiscabiei]MDX3648254.1 long-chain-fatty-acid--CoA ligase [Streptomyces europaeiscabiei]
MESIRRTVAQLVADRWDDHRPGLWFEEQVLTHHEVAAGAAARAALLADLLPPAAEPHIGVLLDNTPEFPLWLSAAALAGAAVAGINPTRRGPELARDILHTECRVLITERAHLPLLEELELPGVHVLVTETQSYADLLAPHAGAAPDPTRATPADRLLLYFTSGSTGAPKAAICSQGRLAAAGRALVDRFGVRRDDVHYICMPMFHGNAVIADWAPALVAGAGIALRRRFSASGFLDDVRAYGATYFTYVGRAVQYVLATEPRADDRDNPLRMGFGTEAGAVDAAAFEERFGVRLVEGYGSSEGGAAIQRTPGAPPGAIGRAAPGDDLAVVDPQTRKECPPALLADDGRLLNGTESIGELVNRGPNPFEGYWRNPEADAARRHDGWYWTGDLFYRDTGGFLYFAGRTDDRLRVDSENLAAAVIENILARYDGAEAVAVYAVPDPVAGDQVMATIAGAFDPDGFAEFLVSQPDLGTKMTPRFVRVVPSMPVTATNKIQRATLRREGFCCPDPVWWRPPGKWAYRKFSAVDLARLVTEYRERGREELLTR